MSSYFFLPMGNLRCIENKQYPGYPWFLLHSLNPISKFLLQVMVPIPFYLDEAGCNKCKWGHIRHVYKGDFRSPGAVLNMPSPLLFHGSRNTFVVCPACHCF